ncbi:unnamed protein product [Heligmosomoides polygyrus]|uniref:Reverse transcriptase domain-containing protein n=1 Tax=Heligmosomoides polygyrus TaxID=6339 RepID=A0A183F4V9_HELPZ|nr:unnamed protein product [Heligmosomoides polygyrus]
MSRSLIFIDCRKNIYGEIKQFLLITSKIAAVQFREDKFATDLMFADDIFADSDAEANAILQEIAAIALHYGLTINAERAYNRRLTMHSLPEQVEESKYLGSTIQQNKVSCIAKIHSRIGKAVMPSAY